MEQLERPRRLRDDAYDQIKKHIISGEYPPNSVLYETTLSKALGMSRTPIREALMRLVDEGCVKNLPNNGVLVASTTIKEIEEIFDLRVCLEKHVVEELFESGLPYDLSSLEKSLAQQEEALISQDMWEFFEANRIFHLEFVKLLGNNTLFHIMQGLRDKSLQSGFHALRKKAKLEDAIAEHKEIINALKDRDKNKAIKVVRNHAINSKKRLMGLTT